MVFTLVTLTFISYQNLEVVTASDNELQPNSIIPIPASTKYGSGHFVINQKTILSFAPHNKNIAKIVEHFQNLIADSTPYKFSALNSNRIANRIHFALEKSITNAEGYKLEVTPNQISITASTEHGLFYGGVTLWQLLTQGTDESSQLGIPVQLIDDAPRFKWRGIMLDSARHFQSTVYIKKFIDWLSLHKFNIFHWHLVDDQRVATGN